MTALADAASGVAHEAFAAVEPDAHPQLGTARRQDFGARRSGPVLHLDGRPGAWRDWSGSAIGAPPERHRIADELVERAALARHDPGQAAAPRLTAPNEVEPQAELVGPAIRMCRIA